MFQMNKCFLLNFFKNWPIKLLSTDSSISKYRVIFKLKYFINTFNFLILIKNFAIV